jgi:PAS domain S-box-containing protein
MTIKQKIFGKSLGSALVVAAVGLLSAVSMLRMGRTLHTIEGTWLRDTRDADLLEGAAANIDQIIDGYAIALRNRQQTEVGRLRAEVDAAFDQIADATSRLDQTRQLTDAARRSPNDGSARDDRHQLEVIKQQAQLSREYWSKLRSDIDDNGDARSDPELLDRLTHATGMLMRGSLDFESGAKDDMMHGVQAAQDRATKSVHLLAMSMVFAVFLLLGLGVLVAMPLAARLARLRDGAVEVGKGNLEAHINVGSDDEIGQLATAFNEMAGGLRRSRDEVRESESKFRELAEAIREVFWITNADCSKVQYVNPAYEEVWGRSRQSIYDQPRSFADAIVPEDRPRVLTALENMATCGMDEEFRIERPDGTIRWIHDRGFAVHGENGQVQRVVGIAADVTQERVAEVALRRAHVELEHRVEVRTAELVQANEALRRSEAELQRAKEVAEAANHSKSVVLDTALDAVVSIDASGAITTWNLQAETMFGWPRTEAIGMAIDQMIIPDRYRAAHLRGIEGFFATGHGPVLNKLLEITAIRREGGEFPVELSITPAMSAGKHTFTAFIRDITLRKQVESDLRQAKEAAENASRAKSEFLANMSHEIRTPLNGVIGMTDLLLDTVLDAKQLSHAQLIKTSGTSLAELIDDILDFSKIEAQKLEIESVDFDLFLLVEDVTEMMSLKAVKKGLDLTCLTNADVPRYLKGDAGRVKQILMNLINNAIKFSERGSVSTRLTLEAQSPERVTVRFTVSDTGIGIPPDRIDRLFKSFSQVDASTTRIYGGTGLGLAIAKQLAELMNGNVGVESVVGKGSTFWFTVKLGLGSQVRESVSITPVDSRGLRALAVHDSPTKREILRSQLSSWGLEAVTASTGEEAMTMLVDAATAGRPYDIAILDGDLPGIDTLELGKAIKSRCEIAGTVLLILLPVDSQLEPSKLKAAGFSGHLIKPVRQSRLYDSLMEAMAAAHSPERNATAVSSSAVAVGPKARPADTTLRARILVAEDNRVNQIVAAGVLTNLGYACDIVDNGRKAVAAVADGSYDLVLMDCSMPEMDGFEATRQIRLAEGADPGSRPRHMPIIALTANAINGDRERCLQAGMDDYVSKPIDRNRLIEAIESLLAKSGPGSRAEPVADAASAVMPIPSPARPGDAPPPLVIEALLDRCMGNAETVSLILNEFEQQAVANLAELKQHVERGDCEETARVAHALKGASGVLSADALSGIAFNLERMGRAGALVDGEALLVQLDAEVRRCIDYLPTARAAIEKRIEV